MKLHNILYAAAFCSTITGILAIDGWMYGLTSIVKSLLLIVTGAALWYAALKEDGKIRKKKGENRHADSRTDPGQNL